MHPRNIIREEVKNLLQGFVGIPVYASLVKGLPPKVNNAILVYVTKEQIEKLDDRAGSPLKRTMNLEIVILCDGVDESSSELADEVARVCELALSNHYAHAAPVAAEVVYNSDSKSVKTVVSTQYLIEIIDPMEN